MNKKIFQTDRAPKAIGPYSQAIESNGFLFLSGQIPIDPATNQLISSTSVMDQTKRVLQNIEALLKAKNLSLSHVVKTTLFLKNMSDFPGVNEIYGAFFKENPPARSTVEVSKLPKDVLIEIEAIATLS
ncbi:MAG: RidA family protein, partial [Deltaproteobacteria bacterium]|nr:RidA family protein [Deltaproteobacteria bacterium]